MVEPGMPPTGCGPVDPHRERQCFALASFHVRHPPIRHAIAITVDTAVAIAMLPSCSRPTPIL